MSMGSPQMISDHALSRREIRNEHRWQLWREDHVMTSHLVKQGRHDAAQPDGDDEQRGASRKKSIRQVRINQWRLVGLYALMPVLGIATGLSHLFARPIDAWDRWMTVDADRS